ncbi:MAG: helix-turn-helix transcriptional regulator [Lachnospiraceae bacterium]|nr:helix-turn-helix transcriptional regulator [Lachnospiraceae bacterium]
MQNRHEQEAEYGCEYIHVHQEILEKVNTQMPEEDKLYDLADFFKVFADSTRIKILYVLMCAEVCVCDLAQILHMTSSAVSHQLRVLKQMDLVRSRREGKVVFYTLADSHIKTILSQGLEHIEEE